MKIKVEPLYPTGNYLNVRIGIEQDFPGNTNVETAVNSIWDSITAIHMKRYPHLYNEEGHPLYEKIPQGDEMRGVQIREVEPSTTQDKIESWKQVISMCTTLTALERFKLQVERTKSEELTNAYNEKLKQLQ